MRLTALALLVALLAGCVFSRRGREGDRYATTYYDRNSDGIVDFELHVLPGAADVGWALSDTNFSGKYDIRIRFGTAVTREPIYKSVPKKVPITAGRPPVFTTE